MKSKIDISVMIVNYKVKEELLDCVESIIKSKQKLNYEIIVVDNDQSSGLINNLKGKFPKVRYAKSGKNLGYGGGNNLGSKLAKGKHLLFLNPDTKVLKGTLDNLSEYLNGNPRAGIVSPLLLDSKLNPFRSQGSEELTPKTMILSQSFLRKIFPKKNIYNRNALDSWNMKKPRDIQVVPGAAMMMNASLFQKIGGFDENFFLYFEENDISKRVRDLGYQLFIVPSASIVHLIGRSTKNLSDVEDIYSKSRFLYLKKHYGFLKAFFTQLILSINKNFLLISLILAYAFFLRITNIQNTMSFIGDQGWFYLSARDMIVNKTIPLVGIASSHPWLHQGPLWTYMLAVVFWLFGFNPLNGAYLTIVLGIATVLMVYIVGKELFSTKMGLISALFYATSPLAIVHSRTPYHTSPIPLVTLLFIFSLSRWIKGNRAFFPISIFFLSILYNFELATSSLWFVFTSILIYGIYRKKQWIKNILNREIMSYAVAGLIIPMIPILLYDFGHGFPQTIKFAAWVGYRLLKFLGLPGLNGQDAIDYISFFTFSFDFYKKLIFAHNSIIALVLLIFSLLSLFIGIYRIIKNKIREPGFILLGLWILVLLMGYIINKTPSEAYLPLFFPAFIFLLVHLFVNLASIKVLKLPVFLAILFLIISNSLSSVAASYSDKGLGISKRISVSRKIVSKANNRQYNLLGVGMGSQFESFTMNYEYLTWWLGNPPSKTHRELIYTIKEKDNNVYLLEK